MGENPDNFPKDPGADDVTAFGIYRHRAYFRPPLTNRFLRLATTTSGPPMTGVLFEMSPGGIQFVATDAHRLIRYKRNDITLSEIRITHRSEKATQPVEIRPSFF